MQSVETLPCLAQRLFKFEIRFELSHIRYFKNLFFGAVENFVQIAGLVKTHLHNMMGCVYKTAQQIFVVYQLGVVPDVSGGGDDVDQIGDVRSSSDLVQTGRLF